MQMLERGMVLYHHVEAIPNSLVLVLAVSLQHASSYKLTVSYASCEQLYAKNLVPTPDGSFLFY